MTERLCGITTIQYSTKKEKKVQYRWGECFYNGIETRAVLLFIGQKWYNKINDVVKYGGEK
jgi:hypothetical protein